MYGAVLVGTKLLTDLLLLVLVKEESLDGLPLLPLCGAMIYALDPSRYDFSPFLLNGAAINSEYLSNTIYLRLSLSLSPFLSSTSP